MNLLFCAVLRKDSVIPELNNRIRRISDFLNILYSILEWGGLFIGPCCSYTDHTKFNKFDLIGYQIIFGVRGISASVFLTHKQFEERNLVSNLVVNEDSK